MLNLLMYESFIKSKKMECLCVKGGRVGVRLHLSLDYLRKACFYLSQIGVVTPSQLYCSATKHPDSMSNLVNNLLVILDF